MDTETQDKKYAFLYRLIVEQRTELEKLAKRLKELESSLRKVNTSKDVNNGGLNES